MDNKNVFSFVVSIYDECIYAYILYINYSPRGIKLDHKEFILTIARTLIEKGLRTSHLNTPHVRTENLLQSDLTGDHFPEEIPRKEGTKRIPSGPCYAFNGSWADIKNKILPKHCSRIWCATCKKSVQHLASRFFILIHIIRTFC